MIDKLHKLPKMKDIEKQFSYEFISEMICIFGNYKNAIAACGYDYKVKYSDDDLIYYLISLSKELNRVPSASDMRSNKNYPDVSIIQDRFGSWNNALLAAGMEVNKKVYSKEELIDILIQLKDKLGRTPSVHDFQATPNLPCYPLFRLKFGSFNNALRDSGLKVNVRDTYTDDELITLIRNF